MGKIKVNLRISDACKPDRLLISEHKIWLFLLEIFQANTLSSSVLLKRILQKGNGLRLVSFHT